MNDTRLAPYATLLLRLGLGILFLAHGFYMKVLTFGLAGTMGYFGSLGYPPVFGAIVALAEASATALRQVGAAIRDPGGEDAMNLRVAEHYVDAFGKLAKTNNSIIVPANLGEMSGLIASAMQIVKAQK